MKKLYFLLLFLSLNIPLKAQKPTIIYLLRHAEKVINDPINKDPQLTGKGQKRAFDLAEKLKNQKLFALYSTDYQRTKLTAQPLADTKDLSIKIYDPKFLKTFAETLLQEYKGKEVLIIGHSNTVLETIEAIGGKRPIEKLLDNDYDYFFTLKISFDGLVEVKTEHFGENNIE